MRWLTRGRPRWVRFAGVKMFLCLFPPHIWGGCGWAEGGGTTLHFSKNDWPAKGARAAARRRTFNASLLYQYKLSYAIVALENGVGRGGACLIQRPIRQCKQRRRCCANIRAVLRCALIAGNRAVSVSPFTSPGGFAPWRTLWRRGFPPPKPKKQDGLSAHRYGLTTARAFARHGLSP